MIEIDTERSELVEDIEDILNNTDISTKHIIIETLELEKELKKKQLCPKKFNIKSLRFLNESLFFLLFFKVLGIN